MLAIKTRLSMETKLKIFFIFNINTEVGHKQEKI